MKRLQFNLRHALFFFLGTGIVLTIAKAVQMTWIDGMLAAGSTIIAWQLVSESWGWRRLAKTPDWTVAMRRSARWSALWRCGIALLVLEHWVATQLVAKKIISWPVPEELVLLINVRGLQDAAFYLAMIIASLRHDARWNEPRRPENRWWLLFCSIPACIMASLIWQDMMVIHSLVAIAIQSIRNGWPILDGPSFRLEWESYQNASTMQPFVAGLGVALGLASGWLLLNSLKTSTPDARIRRMRLALPMSLFGSVVCLIVNHAILLPIVSPPMAATQFLLPWPMILHGGLLLSLVIPVCVFRIVARHAEFQPIARPRASGFLGRLAMVLVLVSVAADLWEQSQFQLSLIAGLSATSGTGTPAGTLGTPPGQTAFSWLPEWLTLGVDASITFLAMVMDACNYALPLALLFALITLVPSVFGRTLKPESDGMLVIEISNRRLCVVAGAVLIAVIAFADAVGWFFFSHGIGTWLK